MAPSGPVLRAGAGKTGTQCFFGIAPARVLGEHRAGANVPRALSRPPALGSEPVGQSGMKGLQVEHRNPTRHYRLRRGRWRLGSAGPTAGGGSPADS